MRRRSKGSRRIRKPRVIVKKSSETETPKPKKKASAKVSGTMIKKARRKRVTKKSSLEVLVEGWCQEAGIEFQSQYKISRIHTDLYFPKTNTVVELNGCYWHKCSCQKKETGWTPAEIRKRKKDSRRHAFIMNRGYTLLIVRECEIKADPEAVREEVLRYGGNY